MQGNDSVVIEADKPLSQSVLWQWHQDYYLSSGIDAWKKSVPHYITSNPFIANSYAEVILSFMTEWAVSHPDYGNHPFYLLELGAGHGKFCFYLLKRLFELRDRWPANLRLCYIISDFSEKNLEFCSTHPGFQSYITQGIVDFALFDLEKCNSLILRSAGHELNSEQLVNPLIVIANYILDSIKCDYFYVDERFRLHECLINIKTSPNNLTDHVPKELKQLEIDCTLAPVQLNHYPNQKFNDLLLAYNQQLREQSFIFPVAAFNLIDHLQQLANGRLLLVASDKAYLNTADFSSVTLPHIAFHGNCLSFMANFDALARYCATYDGDSCLQSLRPGLGSAVFSLGFKLKNFPVTELSLAEYFGRFSPQDYFNLYTGTIAAGQNGSLDLFASMLSLSFYDPTLFNRLLAFINKMMEQASTSMKALLKQVARAVAEQFYYMPFADDAYFDVGLFMHTAAEYSEAIRYYDESQKYFGPRFNTSYNLGLSYYHLGRWDEAEQNFTQALELKADPKAREWLNHVRKKTRL